MQMRSSIPEETLKARFDALLQRRHRLDHEIAAEWRRARPDKSELRWLEREALRLRGELERYDGLLRTLSRGRPAGSRPVPDG